MKILFTEEESEKDVKQRKIHWIDKLVGKKQECK